MSTFQFTYTFFSQRLLDADRTAGQQGSSRNYTLTCSAAKTAQVTPFELGSAKLPVLNGKQRDSVSLLTSPRPSSEPVSFKIFPSRE